MKNISKKIILLYLLTSILLPIFSLQAQTQDYTTLAPLPGINSGATTRLENYLPSVFNLSIGIAAALAFVMITFGGIMYATSDAISNKSEGKKYIENALWGLLLVLGAYAILYTINPRILSFNLSIDRPNIPAGTTPTVTGGGTINRTACPTCTPIPQISAGYNPLTGREVAAVMIPKIQALDQQLQNSFIAWRITEAMPPTRTHVSPCHQNGTCIDANINNPTVSNINTFASAARQAGLRAEYEVATDAERTALIQSGVTATIIVPRNCTNPPCISGRHFSVYNQ